MATLREIIDYSKANPNTDYAKRAYELIQRGDFDTEAQEEGIDLSWAGRPKPVQKESIGKDFIEDIKGIGRGVLESAEKRTSKIAGLREKVERGEKSKLAGQLEAFGQTAGMGADTIGEVIKGAFKAVLPPKAEQRAREAVESFGEKVVENPQVQKVIKWYGNLDENQQDAIDATGGALSLVADLVGGQAIKQPVKQVAKVPSKLGKTTVAQVAKKAPSEFSGALTGTSGETIREAFNAAYKGGKELDELTVSLRKKITPENLVESVRSSVDDIATKNTENYSKMISQIGDNIVSTKEVIPGVEKSLKTIGVNVKNGKLDFSQSKFRTVPEAQKKLISMYDEVKRFGDEATINEIDTSRQALSALLLTGDDSSARTANKAITEAINKVKKAGTQIDEYDTMLKDFGENANFLDELSRSLSTANEKTIDTTYRKIISSLKTNNEQRLKLIKELDEATDGALISSIAGQQLSEELPRGLFRQISAGIVGAGVATGGITSAVLPALVFASPRLTGEFVRALGISARKATQVIKAIQAVRKTVSKITGIDENNLYQLLGVGLVETAKQTEE